jgi:hypothetical protein
VGAADAARNEMAIEARSVRRTIEPPLARVAGTARVEGVLVDIGISWIDRPVCPQLVNRSVYSGRFRRRRTLGRM